MKHNSQNYTYNFNYPTTNRLIIRISEVKLDLHVFTELFISSCSTINRLVIRTLVLKHFDKSIIIDVQSYDKKIGCFATAQKWMTQQTSQLFPQLRT